MPGEVHGSAKLRTIDGTQLLTIKTAAGPKTYILTRLEPDKRVANPAFAMEADDGTIWHVANDEHGWRCDCEDFTYRKRYCKHCKAMAALWEAGQLK